MKTIYMVMEKLALNISMLGLPAGIFVGLLNFANKLDFQWGLNHFNNNCICCDVSLFSTVNYSHLVEMTIGNW